MKDGKTWIEEIEGNIPNLKNKNLHNYYNFLLKFLTIYRLWFIL